MKTVDAIAKAIAEIAKVIGNWQVSRDKRRMQACIDIAEKYIQTNEGNGEFKDISEERRKQLLSYYRKRFFNLNQ